MIFTLFMIFPCCVEAWMQLLLHLNLLLRRMRVQRFGWSFLHHPQHPLLLWSVMIKDPTVVDYKDLQRLFHDRPCQDIWTIFKHPGQKSDKVVDLRNEECRDVDVCQSSSVRVSLFHPWPSPGLKVISTRQLKKPRFRSWSSSIRTSEEQLPEESQRKMSSAANQQPHGTLASLNMQKCCFTKHKRGTKDVLHKQITTVQRHSAPRPLSVRPSVDTPVHSGGPNWPRQKGSWVWQQEAEAQGTWLRSGRDSGWLAGTWGQRPPAGATPGAAGWGGTDWREANPGRGVLAC